MKGFVDDFGRYTEDVLLLAGEVHNDRKPVRCSDSKHQAYFFSSLMRLNLQGFMTFTISEARDDYTRLVLQGIIHLPSIRTLADAVADRMLKLNDGRMWMAAHWRRGDCSYFPHLCKAPSSN